MTFVIHYPMSPVFDLLKLFVLNIAAGINTSIQKYHFHRPSIIFYFGIILQSYTHNNTIARKYDIHMFMYIMTDYTSIIRAYTYNTHFQ